MVTHLSQSFQNSLRLRLLHAYIIIGSCLTLRNKRLPCFRKALRQKAANALTGTVRISQDNYPAFFIRSLNLAQSIGCQGKAAGFDSIRLQRLTNCHRIHFSFYYEHFLKHQINSTLIS